ncbi:MAG: phospholipid/cholesterol/gamma-HCH transport system ATP-binding protein [Myxococcota bacterium]|jgi:phospholipid/cholesterol/gamma-HCH transport system ATP-binding protein
MIEAIGLSKSFDGEQILENISFSVRAGVTLGLVGPGGVGKSLLLKMLCGLVVPDEGEVRVDGEDLAGLDFEATARMRDRFGFLFQNYALFDFLTVGENVGFPLDQRRDVPAEEIQQRVEARLAEVELPGILHLFPNELSGGMKKRVALARATIAEPPILLYDDPTAGLDPVTSSKIFNLIAKLDTAERRTVVVGHDVDRMKAVCEQWILLYEGTIRFRGDTAAAEASTDPVVRTFFHGESGG